MQFVIDESGATATISLTGRLDIKGAEAVALSLATLSGNKNNLTVDMAGVTFIASIGLRHLVSAARSIGRRGGRLVLLNPDTTVAEVIATSGLSDLLPIIHRDALES